MSQANSTLFASREAALGAIDSANGWEELFASANQALFRDRKEWGDDFEQSKGAALLWRACAFPIETAERIRVTAANKGILAGADLRAESFLCAKATAKALLSPLRAPKEQKTPPSKKEKFFSKAFSNDKFSDLREALGQFHQAVNTSVSRLSNQALPLETGANPPSHFSANIDDGFLLGGHGFIRSYHSPEQLTLEAAENSWEDFPALPGVRPSSSSDSGALLALCREAGFSISAAGPEIGFEGAKRAAQEVLGACGELSRVLNLDPRAASLGGMRSEVCVLPSSNSAASFSPTRYSMTFGSEVCSLGHEWTHALDHAIQKHGPHEAKLSLEQLQNTISSCPPDAKLSRQILSDDSSLQLFDETIDTLKNFLLAKGKGSWNEASAALKAQELYPDFLVFARQFAGAENNKKEQTQAQKKTGVWFESLRDPTKEPLSQEGVVALLEEISPELIGRERMRRDVEAGKSFFIAQAEQADRVKLWGSKAGYWAKPSETLARASEGVFLEKSKKEALVIQGNKNKGLDRFMIPQGAERKLLNTAYLSWIKDCRPWITSACQPLAEQASNAPSPFPVPDISSLGKTLSSKNSAREAAALAAETDEGSSAAKRRLPSL